MESLFLIGAVIGATQFLKLLREKELWGAANIVAAVAIGVVAGALGVDGLTVTDGIIGGLAAAGVVTTAGAIRPRSGEVSVANIETANVTTAATAEYEPTVRR